MKNGLLLYTKADAQRNKWFIEHLISLATDYGIRLQLCYYEDFSADTLRHQFDFCINRTRYHSINDFFESNGIPCFNNSETIKTANDKWETYLLCKELNIPVAHTELFSESTIDDFGYPCIIKARNGHGGNEVYLLNCKADLKELELSNEGGYIIQSVVSQTGVDVRVFVLNGKPVYAVKRTSSVDFRSNFSLGGNVELSEPTPQQISAIKNLQDALHTDYAGFDFLPHRGNWILNEIEDAVGARMLYSLTDYDIGREFIKHIATKI